jgi:MFS transporter, MHS family, proline/betaine transporter
LNGTTNPQKEEAMAVPAFPHVQYSRELTHQQRGTLRRAIAAAGIGNATEWYDYGVYALLVTPISKAFFPDTNPTAQLLATYGIFALSFVVRPIGGAILGPLGDRIGRQRVLVLCITLMAIGTTLIGLIPTYHSIGLVAPALLLLLRLVQGFSTGGEYGGAATFMAEYSPERQRGRYGSFLEFGTTAGGLFGLGVVQVCQLGLGQDAMLAWGWRIPFLVAAPLGAIGLYLRTRLEDTPVFREAAELGQVHAKTSSQAKDIGASWRPLLILMGLALMLNLVVYTSTSYMPQYLEGPLQLTTTLSLLLLMVFRGWTLITLPFVGMLSDKIGRKPCWYLSAGGIIILAYPAFLLMSRGFGLAVVGMIILASLLCFQLGTISATFPALFPTQIRYAGFALGYNIATALFGGTAPLVNAAGVSWTHNNLFPAFYVMGACVIGLIASLLMPETAHTSLRGRADTAHAAAPAGSNPFNRAQGEVG